MHDGRKKKSRNLKQPISTTTPYTFLTLKRLLNGGLAAEPAAHVLWPLSVKRWHVLCEKSNKVSSKLPFLARLLSATEVCAWNTESAAAGKPESASISIAPKHQQLPLQSGNALTRHSGTQMDVMCRSPRRLLSQLTFSLAGELHSLERFSRDCPVILTASAVLDFGSFFFPSLVRMCLGMSIFILNKQ